MAIIKKLRRSLNSREESYREIARKINIDHAMLLRFADKKKMLSLEAAERLAIYLGLNLEDKNMPAPVRKKAQTHRERPLTKRQWFAAMALQGLLANSASQHRDLEVDITAETAWQYADAMLRLENVTEE